MIIKKLKLVMYLPLNGTLITVNHYLGLKSVTVWQNNNYSILSLQKSTTSEVEVSGGAQTNEFDIYADQYEANKHFSNSIFKEQYDLSNLCQFSNKHNKARGMDYEQNRYYCYQKYSCLHRFR